MEIGQLGRGICPFGLIFGMRLPALAVKRKVQKKYSVVEGDLRTEKANFPPLFS